MFDLFDNILLFQPFIMPFFLPYQCNLLSSMQTNLEALISIHTVWPLVILFIILVCTFQIAIVPHLIPNKCALSLCFGFSNNFENTKQTRGTKIISSLS